MFKLTENNKTLKALSGLDSDDFKHIYVHYVLDRQKPNNLQFMQVLEDP
jgi:hypothetical protein